MSTQKRNPIKSRNSRHMPPHARTLDTPVRRRSSRSNRCNRTKRILPLQLRHSAFCIAHSHFCNLQSAICILLGPRASGVGGGRIPPLTVAVGVEDRGHAVGSRPGSEVDGQPPDRDDQRHRLEWRPVGEMSFLQPRGCACPQPLIDAFAGGDHRQISVRPAR